MAPVRLLILVLACATSGATSAGDSTDYPIACRMEWDSAPAITAPLRDAVRQQIQQVFEAVLGDRQRLRFLPENEAATLPALAQTEQEALARQWISPERLLFVSVHHERNQFVLRAREYDTRFQVLGAICESRTIERDLVADSAGRVVLHAFSPLAVVRSATGSNAEIEFLGGNRVHQYRAWLGLADNVGLQVMREPLGTSSTAGPAPARSVRYHGSFLALRTWDGERAECELIGPDKLFRNLESETVRYLARPVRGGNTTGRIQVVRKESREPQPDCEVFVSPQQYSTESKSMRGLTDRSGSLRVDFGSGIHFVSVRFEDLVMKAPVLPGASLDPVTFEVPTRGRRAEFIRPLKQLIQEIDDQYLVDLRLREELKARVDAKETGEVRRLIERGRTKRISLDEVEARLREVEHRAEAEGEDVRDAAAQVREHAAKRIAKQLDQVFAAYSDWADKFDKNAHIQALRNRLVELEQNMDWEAMVGVYEKLAEADPENQQDAQQLRLLKNDLRIKSPEHGQARGFVNEELRGLSTRDLSDRWAEIEDTAHLLLKVRDHLALLKLRRAMNTWSRELVSEAKGLIEQIQAAAQDEERVRELRDKQQRLDELTQSLLKLNKEIQTFLDTLKP